MLGATEFKKLGFGSLTIGASFCYMAQPLAYPHLLYSPTIGYQDNIPPDNIPPDNIPPGQNPPVPISPVPISPRMISLVKHILVKKNIFNSSVLNYPKTCVGIFF